jgi:hypothetical protein
MERDARQREDDPPDPRDSEEIDFSLSPNWSGDAEAFRRANELVPFQSLE